MSHLRYGIEGMPLDEFQNEQPGNEVVWRIVDNEYDRSEDGPSIFVYRRVDRGDGKIITEFLHDNGMIDMCCGRPGRFANMAQVGLALVRNDTLEKNDGVGVEGTYHPCYRDYRQRFARPAQIDTFA